jgi:hypothetical protein
MIVTPRAGFCSDLLSRERRDLGKRECYGATAQWRADLTPPPFKAQKGAESTSKHRTPTNFFTHVVWDVSSPRPLYLWMYGDFARCDQQRRRCINPPACCSSRPKTASRSPRASRVLLSGGFVDARRPVLAPLAPELVSADHEDVDLLGRCYLPLSAPVS